MFADNDEGDISEADLRSVLDGHQRHASLVRCYRCQPQPLCGLVYRRHRGRLRPNGGGVLDDQHPDGADVDRQPVPGACGGLTPTAGTSPRCISLGQGNSRNLFGAASSLTVSGTAGQADSLGQHVELHTRLRRDDQRRLMAIPSGTYPIGGPIVDISGGPACRVHHATGHRRSATAGWRLAQGQRGRSTVGRWAPQHAVSATEPSSPFKGMLWYDTTNNAPKFYNWLGLRGGLRRRRRRRWHSRD